MIAEMLLKRSAKLILGRSELEIIRGVCQAIVDVTSHIRLAWERLSSGAPLPGEAA